MVEARQTVPSLEVDLAGGGHVSLAGQHPVRWVSEHDDLARGDA
ncbi:MAG: hypothetical protein ACRDYZ_08230 [Acidimicrobiales bacterium]